MLCAQPCGRSQRGSDPVETTRDLRIDPVFNPWEKPVEHWNTDMTYRKTYRKTNMTSETCRKNIWESSLFQDVSWIFDGHLETSCNVMETILMGLQFNSLGSMSVRMCCKELGNGKMGDFLPKSWSSQVEFSWPMFFFNFYFFGGWCMTTRTIFCTYFVKHWSLVVLGIFEIGHEVISAMLIFNFQLTAGHHLGSPWNALNLRMQLWYPSK